MHVIRVIPLATLPRSVPQELDYFWSATLPPGAVVRIPLGTRTVQAMVMGARPMAMDKLALKRATFALKRIAAVVHSEPQALPAQLAMARWLTRHYAAPAGVSLKTALAGGRLFPAEVSDHAPTDRTVKPLLVLGTPQTALRQVRTHLRSSAARVLLIAPERTIAEEFAEQIADREPVLFHGAMGIKATRHAFTRIRDGATLVIGTRSVLFAPHPRLTHIVVEDPLHEAYKSDSAPRYAGPDVARTLAGLHGARLTFVSPSLSATHAFLESCRALTIRDERSQWPNVHVIDTRATRGVLSPYVQDDIDRTLADNGRILLYSARRAYASLARCEQCAAVPTCMRCTIPLRVHKHGTHEKDAMLICYHCASFEEVPVRCTSCGKGRLTAVGFAGSQKLASAVTQLIRRRNIPDVSVHVIDSDLVRTSTQERQVWEEIDCAPHPVVIATRMVLKHRYTRTFDLVVIPQADALSIHPDYRTEEQLIHQLEALAGFNPQKMSIQTWDLDGILSHAPGRSWNTWMKQELDIRQTLGWPPYARIVKLTVAHRDPDTVRHRAAAGADLLRRAAAHLGVTKNITLMGPSPGLVSRVNGKQHRHILLRTSLNDAALEQFLAYVPPEWTIDVDPRSIA